MPWAAGREFGHRQIHLQRNGEHMDQAVAGDLASIEVE